MKKTTLYILLLLIISILSGCGDKESSNNDAFPKGWENVSQLKKDMLFGQIGYIKMAPVDYKTYSNLPIKKDLSTFTYPDNILGQFIARMENLSLSNYEKGLESGSDRNLRQEQISSFFNINKDKVTVILSSPLNYKIDDINYDDFNSFNKTTDIDNFEKKLKEEFSIVVPYIKDLHEHSIQHIRVVDLIIPITYYTQNDVAYIESDYALFDKLNFQKTMTLSDFYQDITFGNYVSKYLATKDSIIPLVANLSYVYKDNMKLKIKGDKEFLNSLERINKGSDFITEITLHAWRAGLDHSRKGYLTEFLITSFKLKNSNKRFILNQYVNKITYSQGYSRIYIIADDNAPFLLEE